MTARVAEDPFALELVDSADGDVLRTSSGGRFGPLGYAFDMRQAAVNNAYLGYYAAAELNTVSFHAKQLLGSRPDGAALVLDVATDDPLGHRLEVRLEPAGEGAVTVTSRIAPGSGPFAGSASTAGASFEGVGGERYLGFGERSNAVDQTGGSVFNWAEEGPFSSGDAEDVVRPTLPDFTFPTGPTTTNFPIPWLVSTRGFGVLIDQTQRSYFELGNPWEARTEAGEFRFTAFAGPKPADVLRRYSATAGRQPAPAPWIFGPWYQPTLEKSELELARRFRAEDVPVSVAQTYTHYLPCGAQRGREAKEKAMVDGYHSLGYAITTYFNPHVCTSYSRYDEAARNGWLVKNTAGQPYLLTNPFTADQQVSEVDFTNPAAVDFYGRLLDEAPYDGWMEDFGEYTPTDSVFSDGRRGLEMHNRYPVLYHCASFQHTGKRAPAVFVRSGFHGSQPCSRVVWGGDPTEDWSCADGLCAAVHEALSIGLSGVAYWGSDIGGFHAIVNPRTDDELGSRWLEFGAVSGVMRTQANGLSVASGKEKRSQVWSKDVLPIWRRWSKLRTQLYPYLAAASEEYQRSGMPISRQLSLSFPDDARAVKEQEEFMFGPDLLAAPVIQPKARARKLYLPDGQWVDLWRAVDYEPSGGSFLLRRAELLSGGRDLTVPAPLDELPLLARAGAILPLLSPDVDTLTGEGGGSGLVHLADRSRKLGLLVLPRDRTSASFLGDGESVSSTETRRGLTLKIAGRRKRFYDAQISMATLRRPFAPRRLQLKGRRLKRRAWSYDASRQVLKVRFRAQDATLRITGRRKRTRHR